MSTLKDRLLDAYQAAAETVRPETIPGPPHLGSALVPPRRPVRRRRGARRGVPLAAAAAVAVVAVTATVVAPRLPRPPSGSLRPSSTPRSATGRMRRGAS
jgi:hypothetical protein